MQRTHKLPDVSRNLINAIDTAIISKHNSYDRIGGGISIYYLYNGFCHKLYLVQNCVFAKQKNFYSDFTGRQYVSGSVSTPNESDRGVSHFNVAALHIHPMTADKLQKQIIVKLTSKELESVSKIICMVVKNIADTSSEYGEASIIFGSNFAVKGGR